MGIDMTAQLAPVMWLLVGLMAVASLSVFVARQAR